MRLIRDDMGRLEIAGDDKPAPTQGPSTTRKLVEKAGDSLLRLLGSPLILVPKSILKTKSNIAGQQKDLGREGRTLGGYSRKSRKL